MSAEDRPVLGERSTHQGAKAVTEGEGGGGRLWVATQCQLSQRERSHVYE